MPARFDTAGTASRRPSGDHTGAPNLFWRVGMCESLTIDCRLALVRPASYAISGSNTRIALLDVSAVRSMS